MAATASARTRAATLPRAHSRDTARAQRGRQAGHANQNLKSVDGSTEHYNYDRDFKEWYIYVWRELNIDRHRCHKAIGTLAEQLKRINKLFVVF